LPAEAQARAGDSVGAASAIAAQRPTDAATRLLATAGDALTQAMGIGLLVAAALTGATALIVARFLPAEVHAEESEAAAVPEPTLVPLVNPDPAG
jgi:hypothetical protein